MRELFTTRIHEISSFTDHINKINAILYWLSSVGMEFDDETQAVILLTFLPESWSGFMTTITIKTETKSSKFDPIKDSVLGKDIRCRNSNGGSFLVCLVLAWEGITTRKVGVGE